MQRRTSVVECGWDVDTGQQGKAFWVILRSVHFAFKKMGGPMHISEVNAEVTLAAVWKEVGSGAGMNGGDHLGSYCRALGKTG